LSGLVSENGKVKPIVPRGFPQLLVTRQQIQESPSPNHLERR